VVSLLQVLFDSISINLLYIPDLVSVKTEIELGLGVESRENPELDIHSFFLAYLSLCIYQGI
jgi:hypothetical protein